MSGNSLSLHRTVVIAPAPAGPAPAATAIRPTRVDRPQDLVAFHDITERLVERIGVEATAQPDRDRDDEAWTDADALIVQPEVELAGRDQGTVTVRERT